MFKLKDIQQKVKDLLQKKQGYESQLPILGGQSTPMNITDALKGANPNYASGTQYGVNCQRCVQTDELKRRGYDVEALPKPKKNHFGILRVDYKDITTDSSILISTARW